MLFAIKLVALVPLALVAFAVDAQVSFGLAGWLFPLEHPRPYLEMISAAIVGALVAGMVVAYPLVRLFPLRYWIGALLISLPYMTLRIDWLMMYSGEHKPRIVATALFELLFFPAAIVLCAWVLARLTTARTERANRTVGQQG